MGYVPVWIFFLVSVCMSHVVLRPPAVTPDLVSICVSPAIWVACHFHTCHGPGKCCTAACVLHPTVQPVYGTRTASVQQCARTATRTASGQQGYCQRTVLHGRCTASAWHVYCQAYCQHAAGVLPVVLAGVLSGAPLVWNGSTPVWLDPNCMHCDGALGFSGSWPALKPCAPSWSLNPNSHILPGL